jgi:hypothetical protein
MNKIYLFDWSRCDFEFSHPRCHVVVRSKIAGWLSVVSAHGFYLLLSQRSPRFDFRKLWPSFPKRLM